MPLIPYADPDKLPAEARAAFEALPSKLNIFRMWANAPDNFVHAVRYAGAILGRQKLPANLRELVILLVARLEGGDYEWAQHVVVAEALGCRPEQIAALEEDDLTAVCFDAREQVLLAFAADVVRNVAASEANVAAAAAHFSPQEIVEIVTTAGFYMMAARLTGTTRVEIDASGGMATLNSLVGSAS